MNVDTHRPVEGTYKLIDTDFRAFTRQLSRRPAARFTLFAFWLVVLGSLGLEFRLAQTGQAEGHSYLLVPGIMVLVIYVILPLYRRRAYRKTSLWGREMRFSADTGGISVRYGHDSESRTSWADFTSSEQTDNHFFLWQDSRRAIILPKRGFADAADMTRFAQFSGAAGENERGA